MTARFPVPEAYRELERFPQRDLWCDRLPDKAEALAQRWGLSPDGEPRYGFLSVVWPVRDETGRPLALKIHDYSDGTQYERPALLAARAAGMVELVDSDPTMNALLLQRLDPLRTLEGVEVDEACAVVGDIAAAVAAHEAPEGMRSLADIADTIHASIEARVAGLPDVLPERAVARGLEAMETLATQCRSAPETLRLTHGDLHHANVLHTLPEEAPRWLAIDPLPCAGRPEWEVPPTIRNRWDDAVATGDPDRALRRRVDIIGERASLDRELTVRILQAVAVDQALWLNDENTQANAIQRTFLQPALLVSQW